MTRSQDWYASVRSTPVTHAVSSALKCRVEDPHRLLAIAVVGMAYHDRQPVGAFWLDLADIDAAVFGIEVAA